MPRYTQTHALGLGLPPFSFLPPPFSTPSSDLEGGVVCMAYGVYANANARLAAMFEAGLAFLLEPGIGR